MVDQWPGIEDASAFSAGWTIWKKSVRVVQGRHVSRCEIILLDVFLFFVTTNENVMFLSFVV